ncbi:MAG: VWA domain-containing protein [Candidatus Aureabacteria bacterium]|nr:VWA domain-containing protein [Candidatus Auribacterota bacterium]
MQWGQPWYLYLLWLVVALLLYFRWAGGRRRRAMESFADPNLVPSLVLGLSVRRRKVKSALFLLSVTFLILALAQPKWGFHWQQVTREGIDIVIAIDTSKSMLATDVKPNRLERAKMEVSDLLEVLQGDRVALVAFAGRSHTVCPPTLDYGAAAMFLKIIKVGIVPFGGTDIGGAIEQAVRIFRGDERKYRALMILSDGEDHGEGLERAAKEAEKLGVKIFSVGIGSRSGELIPVDAEGGQKAYLKDQEGKVVQTQLNENTLQKLALMTGGAYVYPGGGQLGLVDLYKDKIATMEKTELLEQQRKVYENRFQWPLALALLLLCAEMLVRERKKENGRNSNFKI